METIHFKVVWLVLLCTLSPYHPLSLTTIGPLLCIHLLDNRTKTNEQTLLAIHHCFAIAPCFATIPDKTIATIPDRTIATIPDRTIAQSNVRTMTRNEPTATIHSHHHHPSHHRRYKVCPSSLYILSLLIVIIFTLLVVYSHENLLVCPSRLHFLSITGTKKK